MIRGMKKHNPELYLNHLMKTHLSFAKIGYIQKLIWYMNTSKF